MLWSFIYAEGMAWVKENQSVSVPVGATATALLLPGAAVTAIACVYSLSSIRACAPAATAVLCRYNRESSSATLTWMTSSRACGLATIAVLCHYNHKANGAVTRRLLWRLTIGRFRSEEVRHRA
jgi:hypothetical protein